MELLQQNFLVVVVFFLAVSRPDSGNCHERDGRVDTTPICTCAYAHFLVRTSHVIAARVAQDWPVCAFLETWSSLHHVLVRCARHSFPSYGFISYLSSVTTLSLVDTFWLWPEVTPAPPLTGVECLAARPIRLHTQFVSPTSVSTPTTNLSGASSSKLTAASRVPTVSGSLGNCLWKNMADFESVDSRTGIRETGSNLHRESVVSTLFRSESKKWPSEVKNCPAKNVWSWGWGRGKKLRKLGFLVLLFMRSIMSSNLNDFSYNKQLWNVQRSHLTLENSEPQRYA